MAHAMQLLSSMLWAFKGTTRSSWEISAPEEADVVVFHGDDPDGRLPGWQANGKLAVEIATSAQSSGSGSRSLIYPFRAAQALALLEQLDAELESADALNHAMVSHTGEFKRVSPGEECWSFVDALRTLRAYSGGERWWAAVQDSQPVLWVKSGGTVYLADSATVQALRQGSLRIQELRMQAGAPPAIGEPPRGGSELIWFAAYYASDRLAVALSERARYRMTRWPNFGAIRPPVAQVRVAAALSGHAIDLSQVASRARLPVGDAARTFNALSALGLLLPAECATDVVDTPRVQPPFSALGSLLRNIRKHLGLGV